jgi:hypothetical protein
MSAPASSVMPPGHAWRLEAFDLRAGLAFATFRSEQVETQEIEDWPCLFFSPPDFAPEPIDNVAAALAATRGSFDAGLIVADREAAFKTPEEVAEFVRRAYVSSASGDGSDGPGGGGGPIPPLPDDPREPFFPKFDPDEKEDTDRPSAGRALRHAIQDFVRQMNGSVPPASFFVDWSKIRDSDPVESLTRGAVHLIAELLGRFPGPSSTNLLRWLEDVRLLGDCISRLGLWELIFLRHEADLSRLAWALRCRAGWVDRMCDREFLAFLFASRAIPDSAAVEALHRFYPLHLVPGPGTNASWGDPLEALGRLPLPAFASAMAPSDSTRLASIEHLLVGFVAAPWALLTQLDARASRATLDMVVFASACVAALDISTATQPCFPWMAPRVSPLQMQLIRQAGAKGLAWLAEQLPVRGFAAPLEDRIRDARDIRYFDGKAS